MPPLPDPHSESKHTETLDCRDRVERTLLDSRVRVQFPVSEAASFLHFRLFRNKPDWKPFVARALDMGSCKLPFIVKILQTAAGLLQPLYRFTYLTYRKGTGSKPDPVRNWSHVPFDEIPAEERAVLQLVFSSSMHHFLAKLYRATTDLGKGKSDSIDWHQDNGGNRKFRDLHPDTGFEDYVLYASADDYRWFQVYEPKTQTTHNLLLPSGALVTFTALGNRTLYHRVPKDTRPNLGERISIAARRLVTYYDWDTRQVFDDKGNKVHRCFRLSVLTSAFCRKRRRNQP